MITYNSYIWFCIEHKVFHNLKVPLSVVSQTTMIDSHNDIVGKF